METKKVQPYPIEVVLTKTETAPPIKGQIKKLTSIGFLVEIDNYFFVVGEAYKAVFTIPVLNNQITENVKVIKTMDKFKDPTGKIKTHLIEFHFKSLNSENRKSISLFTSSINQTEK